MRDGGDDRTAAEAELRESEERLRSVFEATTDAVFVRGSDGRFVEVNSVAVERYGYSRDEFLRMLPQELMHPDFVPAMAEAGRAAIATRRPFESRHVRKDGTDFPVEIVACPFVIQGQTYVFTSCRDISERKCAEAMAAELEEKADQARHLEVVGQLAGGVAHQFNNILAAMMLTMEELTSPGLTLGQVHTMASELLESAGRASTLVQQLLGFARRSIMRFEQHDLRSIVREQLPSLLRLLGGRIIVDVELAEGPVWFHGDASTITQVLTNLCANSRDAMADGGRLTIATSEAHFDHTWAGRQPGARPGHYACLQVRDTGHGIDPAARDHLFEPFFTTKDVGEGPGLGLAATYGIVSQHGGFIEVETEQDKGTTFCVYLPCAEVE